MDPTEKATLGTLLNGCTRTTSNPPPVTGPPPPPPKVILYGDSLSKETEKVFAWFTWHGGYRAVAVVWGGGTAPCDWLTHMREDVSEHKPAAVVVQFSGAAITSCMEDRDLYEAYREDARTATQIFVNAGVPVVWVSTPLPENPDFAAIVREINRIEQEAATTLGQTYVDAGASVLDDGRYSRTLPCLAHETTTHGCKDGRIVVRAPDGAHLCPRQEFPCTVYSSGALRYGQAQAHAVLRRVGARSSRPAEPVPTQPVS